jgi:hypothetical protein
MSTTTAAANCHYYQKLAAGVSLQLLTGSQRVALIEWGLTDRCEVVRAACTAMVCKNWLRNSEGQPTVLLQQLNTTEVITAAVDCDTVGAAAAAAAAAAAVVGTECEE